LPDNFTVYVFIKPVRFQCSTFPVKFIIGIVGIAEVAAFYIPDRTAKSRHPLEEGDPCLSNLLKALDSRLRGNDFSGIHRLFAEKSFRR